MSLATWGDVVFEVTDQRMRTWQDMRRAGESRWHEHEVFAAKPLPEFLGPALESITMSVRLDAARGIDPVTELDALRKKRDAGSHHTLTVGPDGDVVFECTLRGLSEEHRRHDATGKLVMATAELTFREYA